MKFSHFFIERPIFAMVISIVIVIAGMLAYVSLPTAQYPEIAPPDRSGHCQLSGRRSQGGGRNRGHADRRTGQRR